MIAQRRNYSLAHLGRQRLAAADRIYGVGIEHGDDAGGVACVGEIRLTHV